MVNKSLSLFKDNQLTFCIKVGIISVENELLIYIISMHDSRIMNPRL